MTRRAQPNGKRIAELTTLFALTAVLSACGGNDAPAPAPAPAPAGAARPPPSAL